MLMTPRASGLCFSVFSFSSINETFLVGMVGSTGGVGGGVCVGGAGVVWWVVGMTAAWTAPVRANPTLTLPATWRADGK